MLCSDSLKNFIDKFQCFLLCKATKLHCADLLALRSRTQPKLNITPVWRVLVYRRYQRHVVRGAPQNTKANTKTKVEFVREYQNYTLKNGPGSFSPLGVKKLWGCSLATYQADKESVM